MEKHPSSSELLRRCLLGRRDADWRQFISRHGGLLQGVVARMLLRRIPRFVSQELEDAVQDFYLRLLKYSGNFGGSSDRELWAFLCRTAASVVIDTWRHAERRGSLVLISAGLLTSNAAWRELCCLAPSAGRPQGVVCPQHRLPDCWLDRGPEEILLAREAALALYFSLPKRRRRLVWREISRPLV